MIHSIVIVGKRKVTCSCRADGEYSFKWDCHYCPVGLVWLDDECKCPEDKCEYKGRPLIPNKNPDEVSQSSNSLT